MDYKEAGVNIEEGYKAVSKYRELSKGTMNRAVINDIGSFAGMFSLKELIQAGKGMTDPVLVSGTDGVGTKLDLAFRTGKYDTVGIDCVAMCVNDILCHGAQPLFFLDYLACGKLDAAVAAELVKGVATGCHESGCVLLGGETAEMPGFYDPGKYDIAGFAVGIVDRSEIIDGRAIRNGDVLLGIASSGVHSNGFSLVRRLISDLDEDFGGSPIGTVLLEPTRLYGKAVQELMKQIPIHGMAHITGGGFYENIPRMFSEPHTAVIERDSWKIPPIFARLASGVAGLSCTGAEAQKEGTRILEQDEQVRQKLFNTYNMGIGFVLALDPADADKAIEILDSASYPAWKIGRVEAVDNENIATGGKAAEKGTVRFVRA